MRAGWYERTGAASEVLVVGTMEDPRPGPGEVLVRLHASGINPSDVKRRADTRNPMAFPRIVPHSDGAGRVEALGEGVSGFAPGDRVWVFNAQHGRAFGTAAERIVLPAFQVRPLPEGVSFTEGACFGIPLMTAHRVVTVTGTPAGRWVYVPGAASRVGAYCVQLAARAGARVIAAARGAETIRAVARLGAETVLDREREDLAPAILERTGGYGVDLICEVEFGGNLPVNERILAEHGSIVSYASARVPRPVLTVSPRRARNMSLYFVFCYTMPEAAMDAAARAINEAAAGDGLIHRIASCFPLADLAEAHGFAESRSGEGHVVVEM